MISTGPKISHEAKVLCEQFMPSVCTLELLCKPSDKMLRFIREQMGLPIDEDTMNEVEGASAALVAE